MPTREPLTCSCCLMTEGVERFGVSGCEVDPVSGLCLYCQPCPNCGAFDSFHDGRHCVECGAVDFS